MRCGVMRDVGSLRLSARNIRIGTRSVSSGKSCGEPLDQGELLDFAAAALEKCGIRYAITGSHASIAYGENRLTNDIDIVIELNPTQLRGLIREFPSDRFYTSEDGALYAARQGGQFNIIDQESIQKIDFIVPGDPQWPDQFARRVLLATDAGRKAWFISPEDLVLKKMDFYREGGSDKHLRDIGGMLRISGDKIDRGYITEWATRLGLLEIWNHLVADSKSAGA